jgi:hypothetical protein
MKILILVLILNNIFNNILIANDSFISGSGKNYSTARNTASKVVFSQGMKIIGQNHSIDKDGNWTVTLRVRKLK